jgi:hypothetical protein
MIYVRYEDFVGNIATYSNMITLDFTRQRLKYQSSHGRSSHRSRMHNHGTAADGYGSGVLK